MSFKKKYPRFVNLLFFFCALSFGQLVFAQEAADVFVKRISTTVLDAIKSDQSVLRGNVTEVTRFIEQHISPHIDFELMARTAVGRPWRDASEQKKRLIEEFKTLLIRTYSGALSQVYDQNIDFLPLRATDTGDDAIVRSEVRSQKKGGAPLQISYRVKKMAASWKIYDVNVSNFWLVQSYRSSFNSEIKKAGISGLIRSLQEKNRKALSLPAR